MLVLLAAASLAAQTAQPQRASPPGRDPALLHKHLEQIVAQKEGEQEASLRKLLALGGPDEEQAEVTARLASVLRAHALKLGIAAQAEADAGDEAQASRDKTRAADARSEAIARYRELLGKFPKAGKLDEALFFLADALQDSGRDQEAVQAARELVQRFPKSPWAPASHVFIGEHLFEEAKVAEALAQYNQAAQVTTDEIYPYALYKAAWCRFNQSGFADAMKLLHKVVEVSLGGDATRPLQGSDANKVQLAREARRDYVMVYGRVGKPETAHDEFDKQFGKESGQKMLELYGKLLFDTGRDPDAQLIYRQLLAMHGDRPLAALDQTRLLMLSARGGRRKELLGEAKALVDTFQRVAARKPASTEEEEALDEARKDAEETLRNLAVQTHNEAKKTSLDDTFAATKALYSDYLTLFPDAPDAYDLRFFDGELLYGLGEKQPAAALYEAVTKLDLAAQQAKKKPGRWLSKAAWSAVLSRDEVVQAQAKKSAPEAAQQSEAESDVRKAAAQRAITGDEEQLARACLLYLEALPEGPHAVEVAFKVGRLEYLSGKLDGAQAHLSWIALTHPEHELAEYAANLVLDIANLRKDWKGVHGWAVKFLADKKLTAHGTLHDDLRRIEEQSAYLLADEQRDDGEKAKALLAFSEQHAHGTLADKAIFGAAAALSRTGRIDDALAARARLWKEQAQSPLVPRALLASAADHAAVGDFGDAAGLLEKYAAGYRKQADTAKWRKEHPRPAGSTPAKPAEGPVYDEHKAQSGLHDAAVLREARGELKQALSDRTLALQIWKKPADSDEQEQAVALLRARLGESSRAARDLAAVARQAQKKPALQISSWHEAARLFAKAHETDHARWAWAELEKAYRALGPKAREKLPEDAVAAAAEAHLALGDKAFDDFKKQRIEPPLMATLNRKVRLFGAVRKRAEEAVAMRQAEPAVCALVQIGEGQILLGKSIAESPTPKGLNAGQRKLYRAAVQEKAEPLYVEARDLLLSAEAKAHELGVTSSCASKAVALLDKVNARPPVRPESQATQLEALQAPLAPVPPYVDGDGKAVGDEPGGADDEGEDDEAAAGKPTAQVGGEQ